MPDTIEHGAQSWSNEPQKSLESSTIYKNLHFGGRKREIFGRKWIILWKNNLYKKKKFFSKHPVAKKALVFHNMLS